MAVQLGETVDVRVITGAKSRLKRGIIVGRTFEQRSRFDIRFDDDSSIAVGVEESVIQKVEDENDQTYQT